MAGAAVGREESVVARGHIDLRDEPTDRRGCRPLGLSTVHLRSAPGPREPRGLVREWLHKPRVKAAEEQGADAVRGRVPLRERRGAPGSIGQAREARASSARTISAARSIEPRSMLGSSTP
jgi:hypothetical protein